MPKILWLVMATALSLVTCGSDSPPSLCAQVASVTCEKACSCREGPTCAMGGGGFTLTFPSEADCRGLLVTFGCSMGGSATYNDAAACLPLVQAATCTGTGADGALSFPTDMACQTPPPP